VIVEDRELEATPGSNAMIRCSASGNVADIDRIEWKREDKQLPTGTCYLMFSSAVSMYV